MTTPSTANQIIGTMVLTVFVVFCVQKVLSGQTIEGWINYPLRPVPQPISASDGRPLYASIQTQLAPPVLTVPGTQQLPLSPRFSNTGYGANITYNLPSVDKLAADPLDPTSLSFSDPMAYVNAVETGLVKEDFKYQAGSPSGEYQALQKNNIDSGNEVNAALPVQTMSNLTGSGGSKVPLVMDRFIVANMKSYKYGQGDMIRGDLAIVPVLPNADPNSCTWFRPSVNPSIDLNPGALAVLGGANNSSNRQTVQLMMQGSQGVTNTMAGEVWQPPANTAVGAALAANATMAAQKVGVSSQGVPPGSVEYNQQPVSNFSFFP